MILKCVNILVINSLYRINKYVHIQLGNYKMIREKINRVRKAESKHGKDIQNIEYYFKTYKQTRN